MFYETRKTSECLLPSNLGRSTPKIQRITSKIGGKFGKMFNPEKKLCHRLRHTGVPSHFRGGKSLRNPRLHIVFQISSPEVACPKLAWHSSTHIISRRSRINLNEKRLGKSFFQVRFQKDPSLFFFGYFFYFSAMGQDIAVDAHGSCLRAMRDELEAPECHRARIKV